MVVYKYLSSSNSGMCLASGVGPGMGDIEQGISSTQTIQNITEKKSHALHILFS